LTTIPTRAQLKTIILANLTSEFSITIVPFGQSVLNALATVFASVLWLFYTAIAILQSNLWVDTCDLPTLIRYGVIILGRNMFQATATHIKCTVTGTAGGVIPGTMVWKSDDTSEHPGQLYQIVGGDFTLSGSSDTIVILALVGGTGSALNISDTLTATAPMVNVNPVITVLLIAVDPIDAETVLEYRTAVIEKIQLQPGSWSAVDYRLVGTGISGVQQTYAYADSGSTAEVNVFLQGTVPGTPISGGVITAYQTALELVLPLSVWGVNYAASPIHAIVITITMGAFPIFTTAQKALISAALVNFVNSTHPFIASCDPVADRNDTIATYNVSSVISQAVPGYGFSAVDFTVDGTPSTLLQLDNGEVAFFDGSVIYV
jgi:hypothetical protein